MTLYERVLFLDKLHSIVQCALPKAVVLYILTKHRMPSKTLFFLESMAKLREKLKTKHLRTFAIPNIPKKIYEYLLEVQSELSNPGGVQSRYKRSFFSFDIGNLLLWRCSIPRPKPEHPAPFLYPLSFPFEQSTSKQVHENRLQTHVFFNGAGIASTYCWGRTSDDKWKVTISIINLENSKTHTVSAKLDLPDTLINAQFCNILHLTIESIGQDGPDIDCKHEEYKSPPGEFESVSKEFQLHLNNNKKFKQIWDEYNHTRKMAIAVPLFLFVKTLKLGLRRALYTIPDSSPQPRQIAPLKEVAAIGNIYPAKTGLSLLPPIEESDFSLNPSYSIETKDFKALCQNIANRGNMRMTFPMTVLDKANKTAKLPVNVSWRRKTSIIEEKRSETLPTVFKACDENEVEMCLKHGVNQEIAQYVCRYDLKVQGKNLEKLLNWQLAMLKSRYYLYHEVKKKKSVQKTPDLEKLAAMGDIYWLPNAFTLLHPKYKQHRHKGVFLKIDSKRFLDLPSSIKVGKASIITFDMELTSELGMLQNETPKITTEFKAGDLNEILMTVTGTRVSFKERYPKSLLGDQLVRALHRQLMIVKALYYRVKSQSKNHKS